MVAANESGQRDGATLKGHRAVEQNWNVGRNERLERLRRRPVNQKLDGPRRFVLGCQVALFELVRLGGADFADVLEGVRIDRLGDFHQVVLFELVQQMPLSVDVNGVLVLDADGLGGAAVLGGHADFSRYRVDLHNRPVYGLSDMRGFGLGLVVDDCHRNQSR